MTSRDVLCLLFQRYKIDIVTKGSLLIAKFTNSRDKVWSVGLPGAAYDTWCLLHN